MAISDGLGGGTTIGTPTGAVTRASRTRAERFLPGIRVVRTYERAWLSRDLVAAVVLSALLVPQGMAYAELAGLPPITGLYTTVVCLLAYAVFGSSRYLVLGPDSSLGPIIAAIILPLAAGSSEQAVALASMLALIVGAIALATGVARLGFIADLLSQPVRLGYMAGLAATIVASQLPTLFGFDVDGGNLIDDTFALLRGLDETLAPALAIGLTALAIIFGLRRAMPSLPAILVAVVVTTIASAVLDLAAMGVDIVGVLPQGFPLPSFPSVDPSDLPILIGGAIGITLVAVGDTISVSSGFAARQGVEVDGNQEIIGIGAANVAAGFFSGFPVSTSSSRTAVAEKAGARSQLTGVAAAALVLGMLLFVPGLFASLPMPVLAAIIIVASIGLLDMAGLRRLWIVRRSEFATAMVTFAGVALVGVLEGIVIAVGVSVLQFFMRAWWPYRAELGVAPGLDGYHDRTRHEDVTPIPGMVIFRWDAPLIFANATEFRDEVRRVIAESDSQPAWVIIAAQAITDVDITAADMLDSFDLEMNARGMHLAFAGLKGPVKDKIERYGLYHTIDPTHFYPNISSAVEAVQAHLAGREPDPARLDELSKALD
jgi:high affinity sulfate transporter 1